ncbi:MAG: EAL domain-containing protein [Spirochaetia bacterium]|nr:EAL domain-containing protein [Spirochaetia bacterium]
MKGTATKRSLWSRFIEPDRLGTARALLFVALIAYPVFWYITDREGIADPASWRYLLIMGLLAFSLGFSFLNHSFRKNILLVLIFFLYLISAHFFITLYIFQMAVTHVIDMLIYLAVVTVCVPFIFGSRLALLGFFAFILSGSVLLSWLVVTPLINVMQYLAAVFVFSTVGYLGMSYQTRNVSLLRKSEDELRIAAEANRKYEFIVNTSREFMTLINRDFIYEAVNDSYCEAHNRKREDIEGHHVGRVWGEKLFEQLIRGYLESCFGGNQVTYQVSFEFAALGLRYFDVTYYPYKNSLGYVTHAVVVSRDNTERKIAEDKLLHDTLHDTLTGLPNRNLIMDRLGHAMRRRSRDSEYNFAVLFLDLDRFKVINDSLGHLVGDQLLIEVARCLEKSTRPGDTVGRLGGDEFVIILEDIGKADGARIAAERILQEFSTPFKIEDHEVFTSGSIGLTLARSGYERPEEMLRDADTAMYRAKSLGRSRHVIFDEAMHVRVRDLMQLESDLRRALERYELVLYYQPILDLATLRITGFEALIRWIHPVRGMVPPGDFIQLAEETGMIDSIGQWVLNMSCAFMGRLRVAGHTELTISVNVSARQFQKIGFLESVAHAIESAHIPARCLGLELTESLFMEHMDEVGQTLGKLSGLGVSISIDDFGTGYSSMSYLKNLPIQTLKIDQSFVRDLLRDGNDAAITGAIIAMAKSLKMRVVAEGVEEVEQARILREMGCDLVQGFLYGRPVPESDVARFLDTVPTII